MVELDFFQIFLPYSFRLIGPQTKHFFVPFFFVFFLIKGVVGLLFFSYFLKNFFAFLGGGRGGLLLFLCSFT